MQLNYSTSLPKNFRAGDILDFHQRDSHEIAERVSGHTLRKGLVWCNKPACLSIRLQPGRAKASLNIDGEIPKDFRNIFNCMVRRMLGLTQDIEKFERQYRNHSQLGILIAQKPGLRVPVAATPFEALTWAITGQQISINSAISLRRKLIKITNINHSSGLQCYPGPNQILELTEGALHQEGFSVAKARTLLTVASLAATNKLPLDTWIKTLPIETIRVNLEMVRGIGPWTINYTLLRGFGWLDGSLHGDVAVRRGLQTLIDAPSKVTEEDTKTWLSQFSPWRALVGAHIWASQATT